MPLLAAPVLASIIGGGASIAGGMLANKSKSSTTPTMDPAYNPLQSMVLKMVMDRLRTPIDMSGYGASGQQGINRQFDAVKQAQSNDLTARGLGTSPVAGAVDAARENARAGATSSFLNQMPLLVRDQQLQDLGLGTQVLGMGRGQTTTGSEGGGLGGAATNLAQYMGYLVGQGAFQSKPGMAGGASHPTPGNPYVMYQKPTFAGWG